MWLGMFQGKASRCGSMRREIKIAMVIIGFKLVAIPKQATEIKHAI